MEPESSKPSVASSSQADRDTLATNESTSHGGQRGQKRKWQEKSKGNLGQGSKRFKKRDMGRQEYFRQNTDKRQRNAESLEKRQQRNQDAQPYSKEEIESEARQPKRKVAVMIGYAGTGYKGMQIMPDQRTIEGDLFDALIKAGAISKANADDHKKSSFVRCARTDKGVHAAGNVISLKLIIEDPNIVEKINEHLPAQIRVWGIERTIRSFNCYQACDSRWYEYLIPTHCFLPPHPKSYLGQKLPELAQEAGDLEKYKERQAEVEDFWNKVDEEDIQPILEKLDPEIRVQVEQALYLIDANEQIEDDEDEEAVEKSVVGASETVLQRKEHAEESVADGQAAEGVTDVDGFSKPQTGIPAETGVNTEEGHDIDGTVQRDAIDDKVQEDAENMQTDGDDASALPPDESPELKAALKSLKDAYLRAKRRWRIPEARLKRVQQAFGNYKGTSNYHNYTIRKSARDPSAKRHILSFNVNAKPIIIGDTEWLSLKVHGQSFMMHQIRKMVGLASLAVRCGSEVDSLMKATMGLDAYSIPKAPALGLLLERPVFDNYNRTNAAKFEKENVGFEKYEKEMEEFKRKEIYERIFSEEERDNVFHSFFSHVDNYRSPTFLYLSSQGIAADGSRRSQPAEGNWELSRKMRAGFGKRVWRDNAAKTGQATSGSEDAESSIRKEPAIEDA